MDKLRKRIFDWFSDNYVWVDPSPSGDYAADTRRTFSDKNFNYFFYDIVSNQMALQPARGMRDRVFDSGESLPNASCINMLLAGDMLQTYALTEGDDDDYGPEPWCHVRREVWLAEHPKAVSLLF